ncbi:M20 family metallopeptidase [Paenibacillus aurantius]|uniref:M20 family metallopeptidase n=1 Tax=Paenibacillus aurantius TaxID=2918900 RepID=A0AA96RH43_9BACL|nr:M20 family metallopeptidase [Paenibacillus aurantius]WNQ13166.1 M20 family metallopeptidase [Paenibacillus aurantius]
MSLSIQEQIRSYLPEFLRLLEESVNRDSPSGDKALNDKMADWYSAQFTRLTGGQVERDCHPVAGDRLLGRVGSGSKKIVLVGHYDTVWPKGEAGKRPFTIRDGNAYGPGVYDMKAGLLQAMFAIKALQNLGRFPADKQVILLINSDEEIGSPNSRAWIERTALDSHAAFVLEPPMEPSGALKTARKGSGRYKLILRGKSAHAGVNPQKGVSAIQELALQIQRLHAWTDFTTGRSVNVGVVQGGIGSNVVADYAEAQIDVRVSSREDAVRLEEEFRALRPFHPEIGLTLTGGMTRPPMERTESSGALYELARRIAQEENNFVLEETSTGGVSDGNFIAALGVPTLDGLGASGDYAHSPLEYIRIGEIPFRTGLLARLIESC